MPSPLTKSSTPRLSELARHVVAPKGIVSTGWPAVRDKCRDLGITFRPWQHGAGQLILAKRADGKYAATIGGTGLSIPRQVGKTFLIGAIIFALCILCPNLTVLWTAHRLRTAEETFGKMQAFAKRRKIKPYILKIVLGSGEEAILFRNDSRILFGARERGFGLGFDEVDIEVFDEAQRLTETALDDMIPATNQSRQPTGALVLFMGTPPRPTDPGEVFTRMRTEALSGEDGDTGWIEFGADPNFSPTPAPAPLTDDDWDQVAKANPSFPLDTPDEAILRMRKKLGPDSFLREGLGIWDAIGGPIDLAIFAALMVSDHPRPTVVPTFFVDVSPGQHSAAIGIAAASGNGLLLEEERDRGVAWLVPRCVDFKEKYPQASWFYEGVGAVGSLLPALVEAGIEPSPLTGPDMGRACGHLQKLVADRAVQIIEDEALTIALAGAVKRDVGEGLWAWGRRKSSTDISPLVAITGAAWAHASTPAKPRPMIVVSGQGR